MKMNAIGIGFGGTGAVPSTSCIGRHGGLPSTNPRQNPPL